ncbi:hypothetical protein [Actinopolymorpha pittospori]|uniref:Uncharacterized protein n=1 Tax=Actinopolymorpha pittospori TaxID=648752 RepID=A0A927MVG5_9ACTN|nr:hypothetical protein [Actinopolymorpha pittospori]MBE1607151.1 hypothetical protein [Actinopolymorpha pittospori]
MRTAKEVAEELAAVRARRKQFMPTQSEPLAEGSPQPAGFWPGAPGGEVTALLQREAELVIEHADVTRRSGTALSDGEEEDVAAARRILSRIAEHRRE